MAASGDSEPEPWPTSRESLTYQEARNVLDAQRETLADIDDKALRTVRLTAVLLGLFVAAGRLAGPDLFDPGLSAVGIVLLFASIVSGIATYSESDIFARRRARCTDTRSSFLSEHPQPTRDG